ncbi:minichromosome maintenance domain-containing protein 2-like [Babylonia areolata]|uniref:minichromosome maintenance domain-containing protein 2-like n=1 Tax=Babylonia areolata TaxID=304850 RepID=UPI003FD3658F
MTMLTYQGKLNPQITGRREQRLQWLMSVWQCLKAQGCPEDIHRQFLTTEKLEDFGVISITINLDLMQLAEMDSDLANFIVRKPWDGTMLFREVVHELLVVKGSLPDNGDLSRLAVSLRVNAATLPQIGWASGLQARYSGFLKLSGVVLGVTATVTYTKSTKYTCPREDCEGHYGNQYVRIHVPGASEQETVGRKFKCSECGMALTEDKSRRSLSDDLCGAVHLGQHYVMIGTRRVSSQGDTICNMFEVNNLLPDVSDKDLFVPLPLLLQRLFSNWKNSPFVFPHLMAYHFAADVCPSNCFFKLKLLLLISLVLTSEDPLLHVLVTGAEAQLAQRLMNYAAPLATRHVTHTSLHVLGAKAGTSPYPWAPYFVQAGSLMLASGGVCMTGDLRTLKRSCRMELQTALSERRVQVALESRHTGSLPRVLCFPLPCHVWGVLSTTAVPAAASASTDPATAAFSYGATGAAAAADVAPALLDAFSLVCQCDVNISSFTDVTEDLVAHILTSNMTSSETLTPYSSRIIGGLSSASAHEAPGFSFNDFEQYLKSARNNQKVLMTVEGEWLLTSYLIAVRHARAHTSLGTAVPLSAWNTLQALSLGLCRLSLGTAVTEEHALTAICLYEEALTARHGVSALNVFPEPHLPAETAETYITTQLGPDMRKFHSRLLSFCSTCGTRPEE